MTFEATSLKVTIHDDGQGFHVGGALTNGNGLVIMKRRLKDIGGTCIIESEFGEGTTVNLHLVISSASNPAAIKHG